MPESSVVVRCYNEEHHLPALFDALDAQRHRDFEVVLVDSGSTDRSRDIAAHRGARVVRISPADFTFGHSLNVGVEHSRGDFVAIVSAHAIPSDERWLEALISPLRADGTAMVYGRQRGCSQSKFGEYLDFERQFGNDRLVLVPPEYFANNANSAIRRDRWLAHRFDEDLPGLEDAEWAKFWMTKGLEVIYEPSACVTHVHDESWKQVRHRYYREAVAARLIGARSRGHVWRLLVREARSLAGDFVRAAARRRLGRLYREIVRFRVEKVIGSVRGLMEGKVSKDSASRASLYFDATYKAVVIRGPGHAAIEDRVVPQVRPGEVLMRVAFEGVCATDLEILDGTLGYYASGMASYPIVPGHEVSGTIAAVGARVTSVREGDRVVVECIQGCGECDQCRQGNAIGCASRSEVGVIRRDGGYAEYLVTPGRFVHRLPDGVALEQACVCEPLAVVLKGLGRLHRAWAPAAGPGRCGVIGAGPIGYLAAHVLALRGHEVTAFDRDARRRQLFDATRIRTDGALSGLEGYDALVEATGDPDALTAILERSRAGATILLLGLPYSHRNFSFESVVAYDKTIVGSVGSAGEHFEEALRLLPNLDTRPFAQCVLPLSDFEEAWRTTRSHSHLKVVLRSEPVSS